MHTHPVKCIHILVLSLLTAQFTSSQNLQDRYLSPEFKVEGLSTNLMDLITKDLKIQEKKSLVDSKLKEIDINIKRDRVVAEYAVKTFEDAFNATLGEINKYDYFSTWPEKVSQFGIDYLKEKGFTQIPQSINVYLPAALQSNSQRLCQFYLRDIIEKEANVETNIKNYVHERFDFLKTKGVSGLETINDYYEFAQKFAQKIDNLPSIFDGGDLYVKKEIIAYAFKTRTDFTTAAKIRTDEIGSRARNWEKQISTFEITVRPKIEDEIKKDRESFEKVKQAQKKLDQGVEQLVTVSENYKRDLKGLEERIRKSADAGLRDEAEKYKQEYTKVTKKFEFVVSLAQDLNSGKLDIHDAFVKMRDGAIVKLFGPEVNNLKLPFSNPDGTLVSELENAETFVQVAYNFSSALNGLGIKGPAAKRVQSFVSKAMAAIQVGTGIARVFSGDITGVLSVIGGLGGLFGGGGPSPEEQIMEVMQENFKVVNEKLDAISAKIDSLSVQVNNLHKDMANSFQLVFNKLDYLKFQLNNVHELARLQLFYEYNSCQIFENKLYDNIYSWSYNDYYNNRSTEVGICLEGLNKLSITKDEGFFYLGVNSTINQSEAVNFQSEKIYKPAYDFLYSTFSSDLFNIAANSLQLPVKYGSEYNIPFSLVGTRPENLRNYTDGGLAVLFNPALIYEYVKLYDKLSPYFEICWQDDRFRPEPLKDFLEWDENRYIAKNKFQRIRIKKLLDVTNKSIIQQCLISGNVIIPNIIQTINVGNANQINMVDVILSNNRLLDQNLANKILLEGMGFESGSQTNSDKDIYKLYVELQESLQKLNDKYVPVPAADKSALIAHIKDVATKINNQLFTPISCSIQFDDAKQQAFLRIPYNNFPQKAEVLLDLPPAEILVKGEIIYPSSIYDLLEARKLLQDKLSSMIFNEKIYSVTKNNDERQLLKLLYKLDFNNKKD